jgi:gamma-glutamylcyclotransferase
MSEEFRTAQPPGRQPASDPGLLHYFAYGSNMLEARLLERIPTARRLHVGRLRGYRLLFDKRGSKDGSGKCHVESTGVSADQVWGVVYALHQRDRAVLDEIEGVGHGYEVATRTIELRDGTEVEAFLYIADPDYVDPGLKPFDWYVELVLAGARENGLPTDYIRAITGIASNHDSQTERAIRALRLVNPSLEAY